jgi:hypothetical protein
MSISASTPNLALSKTSSSSKPSSIPNQTQSSPSVPPSGEFHHLFLELRACVANVCASSESCELFFSLYSKPAAQFVTEEFLVVIDDHGRPIRSTRKGEGGEAVAEIRAGGEGGEGGLTRVKALIVDLADQDVVDLVLVCRVVRCGALKMAEIGGGRSSTASPSSSPRPGSQLSTSRWMCSPPPQSSRTVFGGRPDIEADRREHADLRASRGRSVRWLTRGYHSWKDCAIYEIEQVRLPTTYVSLLMQRQR